MLIVDSQVHLSTQGNGKPRGAEQRPDGFTAEQALEAMTGAGVDRAVLVTPSWDPFTNTQCLEAARRYPEKFAVMGRILVSEPDIRQQIANWLGQTGMVGARINMWKFGQEAGSGGTVNHWLWSALEEASVPVMVRASEDISAAAEIATRHPALSLCICHMGVNVHGPKDEASFESLPELLNLARLGNVSVKVSGLPSGLIPTFGTHGFWQ